MATIEESVRQLTRNEVSGGQIVIPSSSEDYPIRLPVEYFASRATGTIRDFGYREIDGPQLYYGLSLDTPIPVFGGNLEDWVAYDGIALSAALLTRSPKQTALVTEAKRAKERPIVYQAIGTIVANLASIYPGHIIAYPAGDLARVVDDSFKIIDPEFRYGTLLWQSELLSGKQPRHIVAQNDPENVAEVKRLEAQIAEIKAAVGVLVHQRMLEVCLIN
jgi:hypothetical protein